MPEQAEQKLTPEIPSKPPLEKEPEEKGVEREKELAAPEKEISKEEKRVTPPEKFPPAGPPPSPPKPPKSETRRKIEIILSENLVDIYKVMDVNQKKIFKQKGEQAASAIEILIQTAKATAKKIIKLIREWLRLIPGINKYFLEQETKIKTDKILELTRKKGE